jgi:hypothetical protein
MAIYEFGGYILFLPIEAHDLQIFLFFKFEIIFGQLPTTM